MNLFSETLIGNCSKARVNCKNNNTQKWKENGTQVKNICSCVNKLLIGKKNKYGFGRLSQGEVKPTNTSKLG